MRAASARGSALAPTAPQDTRYAATFAPISPLAPRGPSRVAWLGDSLTANGSGNGQQASRFDGRLNGTAAAGATTITVDYPYSTYPSPAPPATGGAMVIEPGTPREEWFTPSAVSGSGPYTLTVPALTYSHGAASEVRSEPRTFGALSVPLWTAMLSNNRLRFGGVYAHGGYTTGQIRELFLPMVLKSKPGACVLCAGTNDNFDLTTAFPLMLDMLDQLIRAGIFPIAVGVAPDGSTAPSSEVVVRRARWNDALAAACQRRGIPFVDIFTPLSTVLGGMKPTYASDNTHPSPVGARVWAQTIVDAVAPSFPFIPGTPAPAANTLNFDTAVYPFNVNNAVMNVDSNNDGIPEGMSVQVATSVGETTALVTETGVPGKMFAVTRPANASGGGTWFGTYMNIVAGHRYRAYLRIKTSGVDAAYTALSSTVDGITGTSFPGFDVRMILDNADYLFSILAWTRDIPLSLFSFDFVAPKSGGSTPLWTVILNGANGCPAYTVQVQPWFVDLTALGVA